MELSARKAQQIERQNATLRARLRVANRKIRSLEREVGRSREIRPDLTEMDLLRQLAECEFGDGFAVNFAADAGLAPAKIDYHLQRLIDGGFIELLFTDSAFGDCFGLSQRGRRALVKSHLL